MATSTYCQPDSILWLVNVWRSCFINYAAFRLPRPLWHLTNETCTEIGAEQSQCGRIVQHWLEWTMTLPLCACQVPTALSSCAGDLSMNPRQFLRNFMTIASCCQMEANPTAVNCRPTERFKASSHTAHKSLSPAVHTLSALITRPWGRQEVVAISIKNGKKRKTVEILKVILCRSLHKGGWAFRHLFPSCQLEQVAGATRHRKQL